MFRRSPSTRTVSAEPGRDLRSPVVPESEPHRGRLLDELEADGWVLPRSLRLERRAWSLVGTISSPTATPVDGAGLVVGEGWSLDWLVGADDRWRIPAREAGARQTLVGGAPVVETLIRVPGGEAVHRAFGVRSPRDVGDEWVVAEVENRTAIPFATVLVIRPFVADGVGSVNQITIEAVEGGKGRDIAHLVRVDGRPAVVVPRRPARVAVGSRTSGDVIDTVLSGGAGTELLNITCDQGLATMALIFPTPHTATLRALIPVGELGEGAVNYPGVVPEAATVASGWEVHGRGARMEVPDQHLTSALAHARNHLQLAHDGQTVRRDGHRSSDLELGATEVILEALDLLDRPADVGVVVARWIDRLASAPAPLHAVALAAVSRHWLLHRVDAILDWLLPEVSAAVELLDRADRKGQLTDPVVRWRSAESLVAAGRMLMACGQPDAARALAKLESRIRQGSASPLAAAGEDLTRVHPVDRLAAATVEDLVAGPAGLMGEAGTLTCWSGPGPDGRPIAHDLAASAAFISALRRALVVETPDGLALLPSHPDGWYGGGVEVHDLPTEWGRLSYGVRWHGIRPALLWELEPHPGLGPVTLTAPGLDPTWSSTEARGEALLGEVVPPRGLSSLTVVAEHPDIDPAMRRPGTTPSGPPPKLDLEGGSFS